MNLNELTDLVTQYLGDQLAWYKQHGPSDQEQDLHYKEGSAVVAMTVSLFEGWLAKEQNPAYASYLWLSEADARLIWEASEFSHFGIYGYTSEDADQFWAERAKKLNQSGTTQFTVLVQDTRSTDYSPAKLYHVEAVSTDNARAQLQSTGKVLAVFAGQIIDRLGLIKNGEDSE